MHLTTQQQRLEAALTRRLERWANENRGAHISAHEAATLFGCTPDQFRKAVRNLRADGRGCFAASVTITWKATEAAP